jgi:predicted SAM-dependent methyltransferase
VIKTLYRLIPVLPEFSYQYTVKIMRTVAYHAYLFQIAAKKIPGLNLGCGSARIDNFLNIDASLVAPCDVVAGVGKLKVSSGSVDIIYASHILEHIPRYMESKVLSEWYRVLRPGGKIYLCVPDLEVLFRIYLDNLPIYDTEKGKYLVDIACFLTYGGQINKHEFHFNGYSFVTVKRLLESTGFKHIERFERSNLEFVPFKDISMTKIDSVPMSLNVVATK